MSLSHKVQFFARITLLALMAGGLGAQAQEAVRRVFLKTRILSRAVLFVFIALLAAPNAHADWGFSVATKNGVVSQTLPGDGDGVGIAAAFMAHSIFFNSIYQAPPAGDCYITKTGYAKCVSYGLGGLSVCQKKKEGSFPCSQTAHRRPTPLLKRLAKLVGRATCTAVGNPVDITTGRKMEYVIDWSSGGATPLEFARYYSSISEPFAAPNTTRFGGGWRSNFDSAVSYDPNLISSLKWKSAKSDLMHFILPDGKELSFRYSTVEGWVPVAPSAGSSGNLVWNKDSGAAETASIENNTVILSVGNGKKYVYSTSESDEGMLVRIDFASGYQQFLTNIGKRNVRVSDSLGRSINFVYDSANQKTGLLQSANLPDNGQVRFEYVSRLMLPPDFNVPVPANLEHSAWGLAAAIYPDATPANLEDNPRVKYGYSTDYRFPYALTSITDERGVTFAKFSYDDSGRAISTEHAGGAERYTINYDDVGNKVTATNSLGRKTVYSFDKSSAGIRRLVSVDGIATSSCAASNTSYTYDASGYRASAKDGEGRVTTWTRDTRGSPLSTTQGAGTVDAVTTTATWDANSQRPISVVKPGLTQRMAYAANGNLLSVEETDTTTGQLSSGQVRQTTFGYATLETIKPTFSPPRLAAPDIALNVLNPNAFAGATSGWKAIAGAIGVRTIAPCSANNPCFFGGTSALAIAQQDIILPSSSLANIDSGNYLARLGWQHGTYGDGDKAGMRLLFLNAAGTVIGSGTAPAIEDESWLTRQIEASVPKSTRRIRLEMYMFKEAGSNNDGYVDDITLTLAADSAASLQPYLAISNAEASSAPSTGWKLTAGSVARTQGKAYPFFDFGGSGRHELYQDVQLPTDRLVDIDAGRAEIDLKWQEWIYGRSVDFKGTVVFRNATGNFMESSRFVDIPATPERNKWIPRARLLEVPPGARSFRLTYSVNNPTTVNPSAALMSVSARLQARSDSSARIDLLTSIDGPRSGTADTVRFAYDAKGNVTQITNELGQVTRIAAVTGTGKPLAVITPDNIRTDMVYDARGRLLSSTVNAGSTIARTTFEYDAIGQITKVILPDGSTTSYTWDAARRLIAVVDGLGQRIDYVRDSEGNATSTTVKSANGTIIRNRQAVFDELGRILRMVGAAGQTTRFAYDRTDLQISTTDPRGNLHGNSFDALSRLKSQTDPEGATVAYGRDGQDKLTSYADPRGLTTNYIRNGFGEIIEERSPDRGVTRFTRDARGLVTSRTDGRGVVSNYVYDLTARLLSVRYPAEPTQDVVYAYDAVNAGITTGIGKLTSITDGSGSITRSYDGLGNITAETRQVGAKNYGIGYVWNAGGDLVGMTYPSGRRVSLTRDALGQVSSLSTAASGAAASQPVIANAKWAPFSDMPLGLTFGNGLQLQAAYDLDYRIQGLKLVNSGLALSDLAYQWADGMNLTAVNDNLAPARNLALGYSPAGRLNAATGSFGSARWTYDGVGNRLSETATSAQSITSTRAFSYPANSNQITGIALNSQPQRSFTHDAVGNLLTDTRGADVFAFTYNARNRPVAVSRNGVAWASYGYNALEQMVTRSTISPGGPVGTVAYIHDLDGHVIAEADAATGAITREYIWLDDLPVAVVAGVNTPTPRLLMVHTDHLARPIRMTDATRATVWQASWTPWGEAETMSGTHALELGLPGQWFQIETGLAYNWHRHYDPSTGRYTQPDPLGFVDGPSVYAYALNSPFMNVDPDGRIVVAVVPIAIGAGRLVAGCMANPACRNATAAAAAWAGHMACQALERRTSDYSGGGGGDDDDGQGDCHSRFDREVVQCAKRPGRFIKACEERAAIRRNMCTANGGKPNPDAPQQWGGPDEETSFN
jgi:RHS repeat-associated protein